MVEKLEQSLRHPRTAVRTNSTGPACLGFAKHGAVPAPFLTPFINLKHVQEAMTCLGFAKQGQYPPLLTPFTKSKTGRGGNDGWFLSRKLKSRYGARN